MSGRGDKDSPAQRVRGRAERRKLWGARSPLILDPRDLDIPADAVQGLEDACPELVARLVAIIRQTDDVKLQGALIIDALRLSRLGKASAAAPGSAVGALPDVSHLSPDQLEDIVQAAARNGDPPS